MDKEKEIVLKKAQDDGVKFVNLQFTDLFGSIKNVTITIEQLEDSLNKGTWFDGSSIEGFARIHESDMYLMPDPDTYALIPWEKGDEKLARFICDVYTPNGEPYSSDPRSILKKVLKQAEEMGLVYDTGPELEFFLFKKDNGRISPVPHDVGGYFDFSARDLATEVRKDIVLALEQMGLTVEASHHEVAPGQHEIDFKYEKALKCADHAITFKHVVKAVSAAHDLYGTFMPKPIYGENGSGMHVHQSMKDPEGKNMFYSEDDKYGLSEKAYQFIAGQLKHAKEFSAIVAPTVNSYKRLVPGYEAPVYICWAQVNRSALIRIPRISPGRESGTRCELRCPDPSCNPYLAFATMLAAGLDGIKNKLTPTEAVEENVYNFDDAKLKEKYIDTMPNSLGDAIAYLSESSVMREAMGEDAFTKYVSAKKKEWDSYRTAVTDWELNKYLEVL
ncbi:MAG: glutamine synthetase [Candidatus Altiarchaeales archaeon]|nr:glutamine synthetase [Candidatus Altiarchaeales archaeon]